MTDVRWRSYRAIDFQSIGGNVGIQGFATHGDGRAAGVALAWTGADRQTIDVSNTSMRWVALVHLTLLIDRALSVSLSDRGCSTGVGS